MCFKASCCLGCAVKREERRIKRPPYNTTLYEAIVAGNHRSAATAQFATPACRFCRQILDPHWGPQLLAKQGYIAEDAEQEVI